MDTAIADIGGFLSDHILVWALIAAALYFTVRTRGVQFRMFPEMVRLLFNSGKPSGSARKGAHVSSFQAFAISIASRVGTGNLAGVATAIVLGGPGAVFWMWAIALLGGATAFVESTLAQLFKVKGDKAFMGGPAYYIQKGLGKKWWALTFAFLLILTFPFAQTSVQANTIAAAFDATFGVPEEIMAVLMCGLTLVIIFGGVQRVSRFSEIVVPVMAIAYLMLAAVIIVMGFDRIPAVYALILENAFGVGQAAGGAIGMGIVMGVKRGLFSNEAGEGSTPIAAASASVSHPVKQGLVQALGVYTDTLLICSATAFIILSSGIFRSGADGILLTQNAIDAHLGDHRLGSTFVTVAVLFFAYTSIIANYYYGETNLKFLTGRKWALTLYRLAAAATVLLGSLMTLRTVWAATDITMALMTVCNLAAIVPLGKYAFKCLRNYEAQKKQGKDPVYTSAVIPEIARKTECWDKTAPICGEENNIGTEGALC